ncbi:MAG: signal peptide peptidase SppA [Vicinamibacterales bacterium]
MVKRGVGLVLTLIALAIVVSMAALLLMYLLVGREPPVATESTLVLRPGGELHEAVPDDVLGFIRGDLTTVRGFVDTLRKAARDARITTVLLMPGAFDLPFWGKVQELRDAVIDFRKSGKTVVAFLEYGGDREYYLASAADRVFLVPTAPLNLAGVASYEIFLRGALDTIGAYPDFHSIGEYKTAVNQLTERTFTPAHREMAESLNRDMYEQLVRGIAEARKKTEAEVRALLDEGPFAPEDALREGLVDDLAYEDQLDDRVPQLKAAPGDVRRIEAAEYGRISPRSAGIRPRSRIAVIYVVGVIAGGRSGFDPVNGSVAGSSTIVEQIRRVRDDASVKAIVVRVDSPGGASTAADVIWRELMITRDEQPARPLVTSMSDLAASGGYYIAMPGQVIVAQPATLTGSIGIYTGKLVVDGTMKKLGVSTETVKSGPNADIYSPFSRFTPAQRARIDQHMQGFYDQFVEKVARSRQTTPERIDAIAQGRVWTGRQARELGLVDELGGLDAAVAAAKQRARIPADEDVELVIYPPRRSFYEALASQFGSGGAGAWPALLGGTPAMAALTAPIRMFRRGEPMALMPFAFVR